MVMATPAVKQKSSHGLGHGGSNANSGGDSSGYSSSSPPLSPPPSCPLPPQRPQLLRLRKFRSKPVPGVSLRRKLRYFLILPMFYLSGLLMCVGPFSAFFGNALQPGLVYRSHQIFQKLSADIRSDNSLSIELASVWRQKRKPKPPKRCTNVSTTEHNSNFIPSYGSPYQSSEPSGYLIVDANGGLNQQRSAICNAVAVAGLLNAILVIPRFDFHIVWRDTSEFGDIYDEDHFIASLKGHVQVVKELPEELMEIYDYNISNIPKVRVQAWAPVAFYFGEVYPLLLKRRVIRVAPFANRLSMNVPQHIQFLRCLANYEALRFSLPISTLANKLVSQMIQKSWHTGGKYVSIHLRFEEDMVAFSCCVYDGGNAEKIEMDLIRDKGWHGKFNRKDRIIRPGVNRQNGKCPLTPLEVGMMLRGMGFDNNTSIYLASGRIYQADRNLAPLREMFPLLYTKESLASHDELAPYRGYSSRLAALDYLVCLYSEVFVTTQGGNFPHFMMGHRRFLYDGHAKTIMPDKRKLALILQDITISWEAFKDQMDMLLIESDRQGIMVPKPRKFTRKASIYTYPLPDCRCVKNPQNLTLLSTKALDTIDQLPSTM